MNDPLNSSLPPAEYPLYRWRPLLVLVATCLISLVSAPVVACPFCSAVSQTIRQENEVMDAVVIASATQSDATRNRATGLISMTVVEVLKGDSYVKAEDPVKVQYFGNVAIGRRFLLSGVDPSEMQWSCQPLNERKEDYVKNVMRLAEADPVERLKFYYDFLQDDEDMMSLDAYDEFAIASYDVIRKLKTFIQHADLIAWLNEPELPTNRKRLYLTMLGVVGSKEDLPMLESMLRSTRKSTRGGLDALIACYLTLAGEAGLPLINSLFLDNSQATYPDTYAAIMAIRFHGTEGDVIARSALVESLHLILKRPDIVDLVMPDLARWEDWSQITRAVELFEQSDANNNFIRAPIINYLRACPLPEAKEALEEIKKADPKGYRRASTYFSIPTPDYKKDFDDPSLKEDAGDEADQSSTDNDAESNDSKPEDAASRLPLKDRKYVKKRINAESRVAGQPLPKTKRGGMNPWRLGYVLSLAIGTFMIAPLLLLTGGSPPTSE